ncbi:MAG: formylglycine-generating enzyme family protein, partial [Pseudomonadota bacterium]
DATGRKRLRNHAQPSWPATEVNWYDAVAYCRWLEEITGEPYRLPTEAEWEYACRAGARTRYHWGDDWDDANANTNQTGDGAPTPVDRHAPNAWGFWDMHGNVSEWCVDPWHDSHEGRPETSRAWIDGGDFSNRVLRGVSWFNNPQVLRSAFRNGYSRDIRGGLIGFRLAKTLRDEM